MDLPEVSLAGVLEVIGLMTEWEPWRPFVLAALERPESGLRMRALRIIREDFRFFGDRLEEALGLSLASGVPEEQALVAQVLWRFGRLDAMETLRRMGRSSDPETRNAAVNVLREEPGILARQMIREIAPDGNIADALANPSRAKPLPIQPEEPPAEPDDLKLPDE